MWRQEVEVWKPPEWTEDWFKSPFMEGNFLQASPCARLHRRCSKPSKPGHSSTTFLGVIVKRKNPPAPPLKKYFGQTTNKHTAKKSKWISLWNSKHEPVTGRVDEGVIEADSFITLERDEMHRQHVEVFSLNQVHMVALLSTAAWHARSREREREGGSGSLCSTERTFFKTLVSDGGRGTQHQQLSQEPLHTWQAIISNGVLRQFP